MPCSRLLLTALLALCLPALAAETAKPPEAVKPAAPTKPAEPAKEESLDDQARFLAGLPVAEGSPLKALQESKTYKRYAEHLDADWAKLKEERLDAMTAWRDAALAPKVDLKANVFYFFSGPDFLSMSVLYPDAPVYMLVGLEPLGRVPRLSSLGRESLDGSMANLRMSINSIVRLSFFKTNDMAGDLERTDLKGVLPILYLFVARSGATLKESAYVAITPDGSLRDLGPKDKVGKDIPGVRLRFQRPGQEKLQEIVYVRHDVENYVVKNDPGFFKFYESHQPANAFLKAASFLLHKGERFSLLRDFILTHSASVVQDDSGLPFASLNDGKFKLTMYGVYLRPMPPFNTRLQKDMQDAFKAGPVEPLPFVTGYRHKSESNLVLAIPSGAAPAAEPKK